MNKSVVVAIVSSAVIGVMAIGSPAVAKTRAECVKEWQAKKKADSTYKTLEKEFLPGCIKPAAAAPMAAPAKPAAAPMAAPAKPAAAPMAAPAKPAAAPAAGAKPTGGKQAETERMRACGKEWKADKAAGKTGTMKWPQYWSACDKRMKAAGK